ncbi:hypothetical protein JTE90_025035 [Oedothorax gibbosus]|uniref:Uncharacterized protein n=1 Tax=Oedothorax gibbosus TaxID=931172 RepID=A0AAV6TMB9_9ARAC|nr:hypothetical protein JTE90_025035 [Oedothorax gibbosus]
MVIDKLSMCWKNCVSIVKLCCTRMLCPISRIQQAGATGQSLCYPLLTSPVCWRVVINVPDTQDTFNVVTLLTVEISGLG